MVRASNFAEFVAVLSADDAELKKDLKSAETATKASATQMQQDLDKVNVSAGDLSGVLGAVSQAGAAVGGRFGAIAEQAVAAAQSLQGLGAVITSPPGLIVGLAAATVGIFAYRKESAAWIISLGESIGLIENLTEALAKLDTRFAAQESRLKKQVDAEARFNIELKERHRILTAVRTKDPEFLVQTQREIALEKRSRQERAMGSGEEAIKVLIAIFDKNTKILEAKKAAAEFDKQTAASHRETADNLAAQERRLKAIATLEQTRIIAAQRLLISIGAAKPSEFITDPVLKRLAQLGETLRGGQVAQGTFGLRRISGPAGALREGQQIGNQAIDTAEKNKNINEKTLRVTEQVRDILAKLTSIALPRATTPFQTTGAP